MPYLTYVSLSMVAESSIGLPSQPDPERQELYVSKCLLCSNTRELIACLLLCFPCEKEAGGTTPSPKA
jgi:hypothetical protein